jgi:phosphatidate cytidylyltransferase
VNSLKKMLKLRILTGSLLIFAILLEILLFSAQVVAWITGIVIAVGAWEWAGICGWQSRITHALYVGAMFLTMLLGYWSLEHYPEAIVYILLISCIWWIIAIRWIVYHQRRGYSSMPTSPYLKTLLGGLILLPGWCALYVLHDRYGGEWVVFLFALIAATDTGAFFVGKHWGRTKLADKVSPGKTWEGVFGGLLGGILITLIFAVFQRMSLSELIIFTSLCLTTVIASIAGDLLESLFKRQMQLKDSSQILPGHGGVLDRIDSLTSATPIFLLGMIALGIK